MDLPQRKHPRLKNKALYEKGYFFITFCTKERKKILSTINRHAVMHPINNQKSPFDTYLTELSTYGKIVDQYIKNIPIVYTNVFVDSYVIMPNHIHMIIIISSGSVNKIKEIAMCEKSTTDSLSPLYPLRTTLFTVIRSLKTMVTKQIGESIWQTSFHEHIIRDIFDYENIAKYISENPKIWELDRYYC